MLTLLCSINVVVIYYRKDSDSSYADALKETVNKYTLKIGELEQKCFKSQSDFDGCKAEMLVHIS